MKDLSSLNLIRGLILPFWPTSNKTRGIKTDFEAIITSLTTGVEYYILGTKTCLKVTLHTPLSKNRNSSLLLTACKNGRMSLSHTSSRAHGGSAGQTYSTCETCSRLRPTDGTIRLNGKEMNGTTLYVSWPKVSVVGFCNGTLALPFVTCRSLLPSINS